MKVEQSVYLGTVFYSYRASLKSSKRMKIKELMYYCHEIRRLLVLFLQFASTTMMRTTICFDQGGPQKEVL